MFDILDYMIISIFTVLFIHTIRFVENSVVPEFKGHAMQ